MSEASSMSRPRGLSFSIGDGEDETSASKLNIRRRRQSSSSVSNGVEMGMHVSVCQDWVCLRYLKFGGGFFQLMKITHLLNIRYRVIDCWNKGTFQSYVGSLNKVILYYIYYQGLCLDNSIMDELYTFKEIEWNLCFTSFTTFLILLSKKIESRS